SNRSIANELHGTCLVIDLHLTDLRSVGEARDRYRLVGNADQSAMQLRRQICTCLSGAGDLEDADFAIGAGDPKAAPIELHITLARLQQKTRDRAALAYDLVGCSTDNGGGKLHRAAGMRAAARQYPRRVVRQVVDAFEPPPQPLPPQPTQPPFLALTPPPPA